VTEVLPGSGDARDEGEAVLRTLVSDYQEALRLGDEGTLAALFHPSAVVSYPEDDHLVSVPAEEFVAEVKAMIDAGQVVDETTRAFAVDVAGPVAVVRVDFHLQLADQHFEGTDFYTAACLAGSWRITQKLYAMSPLGP
jgi:hypothetical protein